VAIRVEGWPRGRIPDHDAYLKSTLDALVACQAIKDDSPTWCEWSVEHMRAPKKKTLIIITETKTEES
jgi:Holliday junction resolvase RusA-like endonuclease